MTETITLTDEQQQAVDLAVKAIKANQPMTRIGGFAGTGKTTIIHEVLKHCGKTMIVCAYTGKAASVLRSKGLPEAKTIHSCIYDMIEEEYVDPKTGKKKVRVKWGRIPKEELAADGFIIDEASMVGKELLDDLTAFGLPIVAVGDPGQLPPISKYDVNLMLDPDLVLSKIHRQAEGSGIVQLATRIRTEPGFANTLAAMDTDDVLVANKCEVRHDTEADVFICGFNKTRGQLNQSARRRKGYKEDVVNGERIICLSNDTQLGVFNGLMGTVTELGPVVPCRIYPRGEDAIEIDCIDAKVLWDGELKPRPTPLSSYALGGTKVEWQMGSAHYGQMAVVDYGYAITCHKSQGSEWDRVVVINERAPKLWEQERWLYTAVTRAAKSLAVGHEAA